MTSAKGYLEWLEWKEKVTKECGFGVCKDCTQRTNCIRRKKNKIQCEDYESENEE